MFKKSGDEIKFTRAFIDKIKPTEARLVFKDSEVQGLQLRVTPSGTKTFSCLYWQRNRRVVRVTIGRFPQWSVDAARTRAMTIAADVARGVDVAGHQSAERAQLTFGEAYDAYERNRISVGKRSMAETRQVYERWVGLMPDAPAVKHGRKRMKGPGSVNWHARRLDAISQRDVANLVEGMRERGVGTMSNRVQEIISAVFNYAKEREGFVGINPADGIEAAPETARTRIIRPEEFGVFFEVLAQAEQPWRDLFTVLLFIGYRRKAVAAMKWSTIDLEHSVWYVPATRAKNKLMTPLPIIGPAYDVLTRRYAERDPESDLVFPGNGRDGHITQPKTPWAHLLKHAKARASELRKSGHDIGKTVFDDLTMHDLRRTLGSYMAMTGQSLPLIGGALGHKDIKSTEPYRVLLLKPVADAVAVAHAEILKPRKRNTPTTPSSNVVTFKRKA